MKAIIIVAICSAAILAIVCLALSRKDLTECSISLSVPLKINIKFKKKVYKPDIDKKSNDT
jgi:hypothetical protein